MDWKRKRTKNFWVNLRTHEFLVRKCTHYPQIPLKLKVNAFLNTHWKLGGVGLLPGLLFDLNIGEIERDRDLERDLDRDRDRDLERDRDL